MLHEAVATKLPFRRKGDSRWKTDVEDLCIDNDDILEDYWEVYSTIFNLNNDMGTISFYADSNDIYVSTPSDGISLTNRDISSLLDFLYYHTVTGRSRIKDLTND